MVMDEADGGNTFTLNGVLSVEMFAPLIPRLLACFLLWVTIELHAQTYTWAGQLRGHGTHSLENLHPGESISDEIAVDDALNVYVLGHSRDTIDFDLGPDVQEQSTGLYGFFLAKYDAQGALIWADLFGDGDTAWLNPRGLEFDPQGNLVILVGSTGALDMDPGPADATLTLPTGSPNQVIIAKYDPSGALIWARNFGGSYGVMPEALDVASDGSILATGSFYQSIDPDPGPGTNTLTSTNYALFFAKYSPNGDHIWSKALTEIGIYGGPRSIKSAPDGSVLLGGHFAGEVDFDPGPGTNIMASTSWVNDAFIAKYDTDGNLIWSLDLPVLNNADGDAVELEVDDDGSFVVLGDYVGIGLDLDPGPGVVTLPGPQSQTSAYVARFDADGQLLWGGGIYLFSKPWEVELDEEDNVYISGSFAVGDFDLGPGVTQLFSPAQSAFADVWAKYDPYGALCWVRAMGNNGYGGGTMPSAFEVKGTSQFLAGSFKQTADLDPGTDTASFTSSTSGFNAYVARFDGDGFHVDLGEDRTLCAGQSLVLDPQADGASLVWQDGATTPTYLVTDAGQYHVSTGEGACIVMDSVFITEVDCSTYIEMPNVFSPNGDGSNDRFVPVRMNGVASARLEMFNRWGQLLFSTNRINDGWRGTRDGSSVPDGIYYWILDYRFVNAEEHERLSGTVTLLR